MTAATQCWSETDMEVKTVIRNHGTGCVQRIDNGIVVAEADRYYQSQGASFSGWVIRTIGSDDHSDPIPNRGQARVALLSWEISDSDRAQAADCFPNVAVTP